MNENFLKLLLDKKKTLKICTMNSQNSKKSNFPSNSSHNINNNENNSNRNVRKKNLRMKNLSPAKKFRLRLRLEKFQKRWQSREEYFEHDTRENLHLKRRKKRTKFYNNNDNDNNDKSKKFKKSKRPRVKLNTSLNTKFLQVAEKTPKTLKLSNKIDTIDSMAINSSSLVTSHEISQRIIQNSDDSKQNNLSIYPTTSSDSMKCCCHCTCARSSSSTKRKPRRKLSSPYLGDFDILHINNNNHGNCPNAATKLTVMTTQQQQHKYVEATSSSDNFHKIIEAPRIVKFLAHGFVEKKNTSVKRRFKNGKRFFFVTHPLILW